MATDKEKFEFIFDAREKASKKIANLRKELNNLGGPKLVKSRKEINKLQRDIRLLGGETKKSSILFSRFTQGIATGNIIADLTSKSMDLLAKGIREIGKATMVAGNVQELNRVLKFVGQNAGYSGQTIDFFVTKLRKSGIAQKESNQALLRAIQGQIKLTDAVKLGRIAQDAAVIGQMNSSEAYQTLIDAVVKGRVVLLKSLGIQGTFEAAYKKYAKTLGKVQTEMTEAERLQARLNLVFDGGKIIAGAYETAMTSATKQLRSMDRLIQDLQISIGQYLVPSLSVLVTELSKVTKAMTKAFNTDSEENVLDLANAIGQFTAGLIFGTKIITNLGSITKNTFDFFIIAPVEAATTALKAFVTALSDPFSIDSWTNAGRVIEGVFDGFKQDISDVTTDIEDMENAFFDYTMAVAKMNAPEKESMAPATVSPAIIPAPVFETSDSIEEEMAEIEKAAETGIKSVDKFAEVAVFEVAGAASRMKNLFASSVGSMIDNMVTGRESFKDVFKGIAQDFMIYFIKEALFQLTNAFLPGLGSILGGIFDTPVNDRMAAEQGGDFMDWFLKGATERAGRGTELASTLTTSSNRMGSIGDNIASSGNGGSGLAVVNVTISGNVLSDGYVEKTIAPKLKKLINDGRSLISVKNENVTGGRDVNID